MNTGLRILLCIGCLCLLLLSQACNKGRTAVVSFVKQDGSQVASFTAEIAATTSARELGLMYRKELKDDQGMLFIFPKEEQRSFWMKNTYLELDMVFINSASKVVSIVERAVPLSETPRKSDGPAIYVLEIRGGKSKSLGILPGMTMKVTGELPAPS